MKIFHSWFATETNTFAVVPTGGTDFDRCLFRGDASGRDPEGAGFLCVELKRLAAADGHTVVESVTALAEPAGPTLGPVYERIRGWILDDLRAAMPVHAVILNLHGAMVAQGYDDCEGDLIAHVREIVGPSVPIGVELDPHCHLSRRMLDGADILVCFKEYPHTDSKERLQELYRLVLRQVAGEIRPVTAVHDLRMIGAWYTTREPMRLFVTRMQSFEGRDGILSVSLGHGFPWGDVPDNGARLWVVADRDVTKAQKLADQLGREFWELRNETHQPPLTLPEAIREVQAAEEGPIVLADVADNPGGGAMCDSTFILRALLDAGISDAVIGSYWDLGAVALCQSAGVGAHLNLRIGGKCGPMSGDPVDVPVTVMAIAPDHWQGGFAARNPMGVGVWLRADNGMDIVLNTLRTQVVSPDAFTNLGVPLAGRRAIVVKSTQHFHAFFAAIAKRIILVGAPGSLSQNFAQMSYTRRDNNFWPRVKDPWYRPT